MMMTISSSQLTESSVLRDHVDTREHLQQSGLDLVTSFCWVVINQSNIHAKATHASIRCNDLIRSA
jgi:hypothetical protein